MIVKYLLNIFAKEKYTIPSKLFTDSFKINHIKGSSFKFKCTINSRHMTVGASLIRARLGWRRAFLPRLGPSQVP